jgi:hypothetical protein
MFDLYECSLVKRNIFDAFQSSCAGAKIGFSKAMAKGWLSVNKKAEGGPRVMRKVFSNFQTVSNPFSYQ